MPSKRGQVVSLTEALAIRKMNKRNFKMARGDFVSSSVDKKSFDAGMKLLQRFPFEMQKSVIRKSGRAAAIIVRETANSMLDIASAPHGPDEGQWPGNSMETGTFYKKSYEQQNARASGKSMVDKVGIKEKGFPNGYLHMVGPRRPWGNQAWILEWGGVIQLWGSDRYYHLIPRPFMQPAGQNTRAQQGKAYVAKMKEEWVNW